MRTQAAAQLAVRSARFFACAGFGSPSTFLLVPFALAIGPVCWHDVLPKLVMRVEPDETFIKVLDRELQIFNYFIERVMEKIRAATEMPVPQGSLALKAALRASLETVP